jgi:hypothetical protein
VCSSDLPRNLNQVLFSGVRFRCADLVIVFIDDGNGEIRAIVVTIDRKSGV